MERSKVIAFFREFPFLGNLLDRDCVKSVSVRRVDRNLIERVPKYQECLTEFFGSPYQVGETYLLLDKEGKKLATVGVSLPKKWWGWSSLPRLETTSETVCDIIARVGEQGRQVFFVVYLAGSSLVLYKSPKGFTIQGWLEEELRRERAAIQDESQAIDALAQE